MLCPHPMSLNGRSTVPILSRPQQARPPAQRVRSAASFGRPSFDVTPFREGLGRGSCSALAKAVAPASPSLSLPVT